MVFDGGVVTVLRFYLKRTLSFSVEENIIYELYGLRRGKTIRYGYTKEPENSGNCHLGTHQCAAGM